MLYLAKSGYCGNYSMIELMAHMLALQSKMIRDHQLTTRTDHAHNQQLKADVVILVLATPATRLALC